MNRKKEDPVEVELVEFNMGWVGNNKILLFVGKRNTGKSKLVIDWLYHNQDIPICTCISPTNALNNTYTPHVPSRFIFDKFTPEIVADFLKRQQRLVTKKRAAEAGRGDPRYMNIDCRGILIMDDCLASNKDWKNDENINWIFMNGRNGEIRFILIMQYQIGIAPPLRVNVDYIFLCKEVKRIEKEKLWKYYAGMFQTFTMFDQVFTQCTKDYGCLVIDNTSNSDKLRDQVFWYKATLWDDFHICYDEFWENNDDYMNRDMDVSVSDDPVDQPTDNYARYSRNMNYNVNIVPSGGMDPSSYRKGGLRD